MNKRGDFEIGYQTMISLVRLLVLAGFTIAMTTLLGLTVAQQVTTENAEAYDVYHTLQTCIVQDGVIHQGMTELEINACMGSMDYGAALVFGKKGLVYQSYYEDLLHQSLDFSNLEFYHKAFFQKYFPECKTSSFCRVFSFIDTKGEKLITTLVIHHE